MERNSTLLQYSRVAPAAVGGWRLALRCMHLSSYNASGACVVFIMRTHTIGACPVFIMRTHAISACVHLSFTRRKLL